MEYYYVYRHIFNKTGEIFYIGKGKGNRLYSRQRSQLWKELTRENEWSAHIIKNNITEEEAFTLEEKLIEELNPAGNVRPGGRQNGINSSEYLKWFNTTQRGKELRKRASERMRNNNPMKSDKLRKLKSLSNIGSKNFYHSLTNDSRQKHRRNVSISKTGSKNPRAVEVIYTPNGTIYGSIAECLRNEKLVHSFQYYVRRKIIIKTNGR